MIAQVNEIAKSDLSKLICTMMQTNDNGELELKENAKTKENPFLQSSAIIECSKFEDFDFTPWKELPEVEICGENNFNKYNFHGDSYYFSADADGKYVLKHSETGKKYYEGPGGLYLWYDAPRYNWIVSKEVFNPDTDEGSKILSFRVNLTRQLQ